MVLLVLSETYLPMFVARNVRRLLIVRVVGIGYFNLNIGEKVLECYVLADMFSVVVAVVWYLLNYFLFD